MFRLDGKVALVTGCGTLGEGWGNGKAIATLLGAKPSSVLAYEVLESGKVLLTAKSATFEDIADTFPKKKPAKAVSLDDIKQAAAQGAARRFKKAVK